jgi:hypothetical protein
MQMTTLADLTIQVGLFDGPPLPQYHVIVELVTEMAERDF